MSYKVQQQFFTEIIIKSTDLISYEYNVKEFEIEVYHKDIKENNYNKLNSYKVPVIKKDNLKYVGAKDIIIDKCIVHDWYAFRIRTIKTNGKKSKWSGFKFEQAGDNSNEINLTVPTSDAVTMSSTSVIFNVNLDNIPSDFKELQWIVKTKTTTDLGSNTAPTPIPSTPEVSDIPTYTTTDVNNPQITVVGDRKTWFYCWVRAVDQSGNYNNDGWVYLGAGRVQPIDMQVDSDETPPDGTLPYNFIGNANFSSVTAEKNFIY
jgi:hypothetical protein